eukprot:CAMPEP_0184491544 /NCGR_PEP_ID=MMETSP0113_2-20130426/20671_1 /TAXON_ID=91329 /ORGANISM="Norrisiella sphaerica, Strain BC52" /LENGTH=694 /DNA_ID=CAMNT_0026875957 /DNA_START=187 /DNA_END=2271 /DNA_ORIENTATION=+
MNFLGINSIQRNSIGVSAGVPLPCEPFVPRNIEAYSMKIELYRIASKRGEYKINAAKLQQVLVKVFQHQVFGVGQEFCADFRGNPLKCKVVEMSCPDPDAGTSDGDVINIAYVAQIFPHTRMSFTVPKRDIQLESDEKKSMFLDPNWKFEDMGIGGLDNEFSTIFRRAFSSRLLPKSIVARLGVTHTRGMLLFGPPGCGKTLIAREIGKMLRAKEPKIVNGPEILSKYVGESEKNIRALFADAEKELKLKGDDSDLHIIILDELDAICKKRGSTNTGTGVHDTVVNQLLSKIDGVNSLNNILIIGMTNRKDMIDEALLRPGRLEVHVEIGLPDEKGRKQILKIHTHKLRLSRALDKDVDLDRIAEYSKNFSGAEIRGLVSNATTFATNRCVQYSKQGVKMLDPEKILINMGDFENALEECKKQQSFGVEEEELKNDMLGGLIDYGAEYNKIQATLHDLVKQVKESKNTRLLSVLLCGPKGTGKTAIAASLALESDFPFVKMISPVKFVGMTEMQKAQEIASIFDSAYKTPLSVIILDNLERLLEYVPIGPRFANHVLQALMVLTNRIPPKSSSVLVVATCSSARVLRDLNLMDVFNVRVQVPELSSPAQIEKVLSSDELKLNISSQEVKKIAESCTLPISIKQLLLIIEMTRVACPEHFTAEEFMRRFEATGVAGGERSARAALESFLSTMEDL